MRVIATLILISFCTNVFAQSAAIKKQAEQMGAALVKKDYNTFVSFSYPLIQEQMGGKEKMSASIEQQMQGMEKGGIKIVSISYDEPSDPVKAGKELQCTITQKMVMQLHQGKILAKGTLIGISQDQGKKWYFVDAGERDIETVRQSLPNISKALKLPKPEQPQMLKN
jgi:hypothetical protein